MRRNAPFHITLTAVRAWQAQIAPAPHFSAMAVTVFEGQTIGRGECREHAVFESTDAPHSGVPAQDRAVAGPRYTAVGRCFETGHPPV